MRKFIGIFTLIITLLIVFYFVRQSLGVKYEGLKIKTILIKGIKNTDESKVFDALTFKEGDLLNSKEISQSQKNIYKIGKYNDVIIDVVEKAGQLIVTIIVTERLVIKEIIFRGNDEFGETDLSEAIKDYISVDNVLDEYKINEAVTVILNKYSEEGYGDTTVRRFVVSNTNDKTCQVIFKIKEGDEVRVVKIKIEGVNAFKESKITGEMDTHIDDWLHSGIFKHEEYEKDKEKIIRFYQNNGYIKARISEDKLIFRIEGKKRNKEKKLYITLKLSEGNQYKFGRYTLSGYTLFTEDEIRDMLKLEQGKTFNQENFEEDLMRLRQMYSERGYIFANIIPVQELNDDKKIVHYSIAIEEGEIAHIENLIIKGNTKTRDYVILRELLVREGEIFNARKIRRSQEKIYNLGFFKTVNLDVKPGSAQGLMNLIIQVEEQMTGLITLGVVYGTVDGFGGYEEVSENNLFGRGIRIHERVEYQQRRQNYEVGMSYPWIFGSPYTFSFSLFYRQQEKWRTDAINTNEFGNYQQILYDKKEVGGTVGVARRMSDLITISGFYGLEIYKNYNIRPQYDGGSTVSRFADFQDKANKPQIKSSLTFDFDYDSRDNVFNPTRGLHFNQSWSIVGKPFGGDDKYLKYITDVSKYYPTFWTFVLVFHANLGLIGRSFDAGPININTDDLLYLGGVESVRGYTYWDREWGGGGLSRIYANVEHRFPIAEQILWGVFFIDGGKLWQKSHLMSLDLRDYFYSLGWGFRVQIPMIPIRIYFSKRFAHDYYEKGWHFYPDDVGALKWQFDFSVGGLF